MAHKSYFNWSGGKDSALALYHSLQNKEYSIERLVTNINNQYRRVSMHGVREDLLEEQAASIGIPLHKVILPDQPSMADYEAYMFNTMQGLKDESFTHAFFGDIFLEDLRQYRESQLAHLGFQAVFPVWKKDTTEMMHEFIDLGFPFLCYENYLLLLPPQFTGLVVQWIV